MALASLGGVFSIMMSWLATGSVCMCKVVSIQSPFEARRHVPRAARATRACVVGCCSGPIRARRPGRVSGAWAYEEIVGFRFGDYRCDRRRTSDTSDGQADGWADGRSEVRSGGLAGGWTARRQPAGRPGGRAGDGLGGQLGGRTGARAGGRIGPGGDCKRPDVLGRRKIARRFGFARSPLGSSSIQFRPRHGRCWEFDQFCSMLAIFRAMRRVPPPCDVCVCVCVCHDCEIVFPSV